MNQGGYLADYGDDVLGGSGSEDGWTVQEVYDAAWGLPASCAEPEIYYSDMATEWEELNQWAVESGQSAVAFSGVMTEVESGTLSPNEAWGDLESDTGQTPAIPSVTTISWSLQNLPSVTSVTPEQGPSAGGTEVTIFGNNLSGAEEVDFGTTPATAFTVNSANSVTATSPAGTFGFVNITIQTAVGTSGPAGGDGFIYTAPATYHAIAPTRIEDTRPGYGGNGSGQAPGSGQVLSVQVAGVGGVPSTGVSAVALNVTVAQGTATGMVSVFPTGVSVPDTSTIDFTADQTKADLVEVALGQSGQVSIYNAAGTTQIIVDVDGWYGATGLSSGAGLYNPLDPARIVDTRSYANNFTPYAGDTLVPDGSLQITVAGAGGIPSLGVEAAQLNVTAVNATAAGDLQVLATGTSRGSASTLNFLPGQPVANQVLALLGTAGGLTIYNDSSGSVDVIVDAEGWYSNGSHGATSGATFNVLVPGRAVDTRPGSGFAYSGDTVPSLQTLRVDFAGLAGVPPGGAAAVAVNATVTDAGTLGDVEVWPDDEPKSGSSQVNWSAAETTENLVVMGLGTDGNVDFFNDSGGSIDLVIDVAGWFGTPTSGLPAVVKSAAPGSGTTAGGTPITITGTGFNGATAVYIGATAASDVVVQNPTTITAMTPAGGVGLANITVATPSGSSSAQGPDGFLYEADGAYQPLEPARIADTRTGSELPDMGQAPGPDQNLDVQVTGVGGVPLSGVAAVVLNLTATQASQGGFLVAYPAGLAVPNTSTIDFGAGQTQANLVEVAVGRGGQISLYNALGWTQVVVDVEGWYDDSSPTSGPGLYNPVQPQRIADTRPGTGTPYSSQSVGPGQSLTIQVSGVGGVPSAGAEAVVLNITEVDGTAVGNLNVYPYGEAAPDTSTLNFVPQQAMPNQDVVTLGEGGEITITNNSSGSVDVIVDVAGWYSSGVGTHTSGLVYFPIAPIRTLDTRRTSPIPPGQTVGVPLGSLPGIPTSGASALVINVTTTGDPTSGDLQVWPTGSSHPTTSEVNWAPGATTQNLVVVGVGGGYGINLTNQSGGDLDAVLDTSGWFAAP
jgi:hypothetical protein